MQGKQSWITVSLAFQKGCEDAGMLCTLPARAHVCHVLKVYCALQACPFFSSLECICCACSGKHKSGGRNDSAFSAGGSDVGEVSLKVIRSHTFSILSPSLEISRKKIQQQARRCFWFCRIQGQCIMTLFRAEKELMGSEIPGTALCRVRVGEEIRTVSCSPWQTCYAHGCLLHGWLEQWIHSREVWWWGSGGVFFFSLFFFPMQFCFSVLSSRKYCCNHCRDEERALLSPRFCVRNWKNYKCFEFILASSAPSRFHRQY